jgi:hypothetical protein
MIEIIGALATLAGSAAFALIVAIPVAIFIYCWTVLPLAYWLKGMTTRGSRAHTVLSHLSLEDGWMRRNH